MVQLVGYLNSGNVRVKVIIMIVPFIIIELCLVVAKSSEEEPCQAGHSGIQELYFVA